MVNRATHRVKVVDWFCLFIYLWVLTFPLQDCSEFGNFVITLIRQASKKESQHGGQGFVKYNCNGPKRCRSKRCACFKNNVLCNSRCHNSVNCLNKWSMYYVSPMHYTGKFVVTCIWLFIFVIINIKRDET